MVESVDSSVKGSFRELWNTNGTHEFHYVNNMYECVTKASRGCSAARHIDVSRKLGNTVHRTDLNMIGFTAACVAN